MNKAYVICCNDSIERVVLDDEKKAEQIKEKMSLDYFEKNKLNMTFFTDDHYKEYKSRIYWHLHDVIYEYGENNEA